MNVLVIVFAELLFLLLAPASKRLLEVALGVLAADHESDLARGIGGDSGVSILDVGKHLLAVSLELGDQRQMKPLVFSYTLSSQYSNFE